jgi:hypothetical protein
VGKIETKKQILTVMKLMVFGQIRGREGFGLLIVKDNKIQTIKYHSSFTKYIKSKKRFRKLVKMLNGATIFLGHTRFPTGNAPSTTIANLHPFSSRNFMMSHNGSFSTNEMRTLQHNIKYHLPKNIETDSYHLICAIQKVYDKNRDVFKSVEKSLKHLTSFAVWLYDKKNKKVFLFRDTQPISYYRKEGEFFAFASTGGILESAFGDNTIEIKELKPYTLYEIKGAKHDEIIAYKKQIKKPTSYNDKGGWKDLDNWYGQNEIERDLDEQENNWFIKKFADTIYEDRLDELCDRTGLNWIMKYEPMASNQKVSEFTGVEIFSGKRKTTPVLKEMANVGYVFPLSFKTSDTLSEFIETITNMGWTKVRTRGHWNDKRKS